MDDVFRRDGGGGGRPPARNVLGGVLLPCSVAPLTGFFRDGCCNTGPHDHPARYPAPAPPEPMMAATAQPETVQAPADPVALLREAVARGEVALSVRDIRRFLSCSQARASELRRRLVHGPV
jgi:hypothetical protein